MTMYFFSQVWREQNTEINVQFFSMKKQVGKNIKWRIDEEDRQKEKIYSAS